MFIVLVSFLVARVIITELLAQKSNLYFDMSGTIAAFIQLLHM